MASPATVWARLWQPSLTLDHITSSTRGGRTKIRLPCGWANTMAPESAHGGAVAAYLPVKRYQYPEAHKRQARIAERNERAGPAGDTVEHEQKDRVDEDDAQRPYPLLPDAYVKIRHLSPAHEIEYVGRGGEHEKQHEKGDPEKLRGVLDRVGAEKDGVEDHERRAGEHRRDEVRRRSRPAAFSRTGKCDLVSYVVVVNHLP